MKEWRSQEDGGTVSRGPNRRPRSGGVAEGGGRSTGSASVTPSRGYNGAQALKPTTVPYTAMPLFINIQCWIIFPRENTLYYPDS